MMVGKGLELQYEVGGGIPNFPLAALGMVVSV